MMWKRNKAGHGDRRTDSNNAVEPSMPSQLRDLDIISHVTNYACEGMRPFQTIPWKHTHPLSRMASHGSFYGLSWS